MIDEYIQAAQNLATGRQLRPLEAASRELVNQQLHPFMAEAHPGLPWPHSLIGDVPLFQGWRECGLVNIQPGGGKTSGFVIPQANAAPGFCAITSNKADGYREICELRSGPGRTVWLLDAMGLLGKEQECYLNPLAYVVDDVTADELALVIVNAESQNNSRNSAEQREDIQFGPMGRTLLQAAILAAALRRKTLADVHRKVMLRGKEHQKAAADGEGATIISVLEEHGWDELAQAVMAYRSLPERTRMSAWATCDRMVRDLGFKHNAAWTTPRPELRELDIKDLLHSRDTVFLVSRRGPGGAGFIVMAFMQFLKREAEKLAAVSGGRLPVPGVLLLDEICNIAAWPTLPDDLSFFGSIGLPTNVFIQGLDQAQRTWGKDGAEQLQRNANISYTGGGETAQHVRDESATLGDALLSAGDSKQSDAFSFLHKSSSRNRQWRAVLTPAQLANMPKRLGILRAQELPRPCLARVQLWHERPENHSHTKPARTKTHTTPAPGGSIWTR